MYTITTKGPREAVEAAWQALARADPSPADAVDCKEETRTLWRLDAYAADAMAADACCAMITVAAPSLTPRAEPLPERDWVALSLEGLPPVSAGRFFVAGSHALARQAPGKTGILIEAGPAFGTGHHGTTLGCLLALDRLLRRTCPHRVLDLGTGSGVLAIAALKAGAGLAYASDLDPESVDVARENAANNQVASRCHTIKAKGLAHAGLRRAAPYDLVFANILARPLIRLAPDIAAVTARAGHVILSGLLTHQVPLVQAAFAGRGFTLRERIRRDGWATLVFRRPD